MQYLDYRFQLGMLSARLMRMNLRSIPRLRSGNWTVQYLVGRFLMHRLSVKPIQSWPHSSLMRHRCSLFGQNWVGRFLCRMLSVW